jgi:hypothetical protein
VRIIDALARKMEREERLLNEGRLARLVDDDRLYIGRWRRLQ